MQPTARYAVFGHPIAHSRSPEIHLAFAKQEGVHISYEKMLLPLDGFTTGVRAQIDLGLQGANVTVPFKLDACAFADELSERADKAGAANTLIVRADGSVFGDNSDGLGLMQDISHNQGVDLRGKKVLLLGAGGAVRGVLQPLLQLQPASVTIANRSLDKAQDLAAVFGVEALSLQAASLHCYDIIINGTSTGLSNQAPDLAAHSFSQCELAYDMVYGAEPTPFMHMASAAGAQQAVDGLGMLVGQAAVSYQWWRGFQPDTLSVLASMRASLCSNH
ncbi:shikimate dehydrogenase [Vitreoscilla massiliensis]|uniref:Shikimate dehydrogenase (NADP(+)) n=1 Tax=Vitreoscilla massiliensis TaxID=1689272 RepID=A0ABY4E0N9_9NEIS|nr:shikimate dehydrogenase [Vitreoscilla massiliensis]UOO88888.1 shikimate dehydrogenase [Vitreoscilla massiliensis]